MLTVASHPLLELRAFTTDFPTPLAQRPTPQSIQNLLRANPAAPLQTDDQVRGAVRDLLRHGGFKPTGRSKPASEYLLKAAREDRLPSINLAVDCCNAVSLHSGLPISVIDLQLATAPLRVGIAEPQTSYTFNQSGQTMDVGGLLCLFDSDGPCANAVKDSQRTKTSPETQQTLTLIWGTHQLPNRTERAEAWYRQLLQDCGAGQVRSLHA